MLQRGWPVVSVNHMAGGAMHLHCKKITACKSLQAEAEQLGMEQANVSMQGAKINHKEAQKCKEAEKGKRVVEVLGGRQSQQGLGT